MPTEIKTITDWAKGLVFLVLALLVWLAPSAPEPTATGHDGTLSFTVPADSTPGSLR